MSRVASMPIQCVGQHGDERCPTMVDPTNPSAWVEYLGWAPYRRTSGQGGLNRLFFGTRVPGRVLCPGCVAKMKSGVDLAQESFL